MQRTFASATGVALAAAVWVVGCGERNTFVEPPPPRVTVAHPDVRTVTVYKSLPGRLQALDAVEIRARVSGYLQSIDFEDGQRVQAGKVLCVIEPEPYVATVTAAQAQLEGAKANEKIARANYDRRQLVYDKSKAVSQIDVLKAKADLDAASAAVLAAEAALTQANIQLSYTTNVAPVAGRVSRKRVSEGNLVGGANPTLITTLLVEHPIYLYFNANERDLLRWMALHDREAEGEGQGMKLRLADGTVYPQEGTVDYLDNRVDPETGTIEARAVFPNENGDLIPGLYGDLLAPQVYTNAVLVPDLAIQRDIGGAYVLIVGEGDEVDSRYVEPGPKVADQRIIEKGLDGSEQVVVEGVQRARPGLKVAPQMAGQASSPDKDTAQDSE